MAVVRLFAWCVLDGEAPGQASFGVSEHAVLDDGREIVLQDDRGFSGVVHGPGPADFWRHMTAEGIERDVLTVVLPDDAEETGEEHLWEWFVATLAEAGVAETVEHLRTVPYEVRLAPEVLARIPIEEP